MGGDAMSVRITKKAGEQPNVLKVDGHLRREDAPELLRECGGIPGAIVLDLDQLWSADREGIEALQQLVSQGVELQGVSPYIRLLLDSGTVSSASNGHGFGRVA